MRRAHRLRPRARRTDGRGRPGRVDVLCRRLALDSSADAAAATPAGTPAHARGAAWPGSVRRAHRSAVAVVSGEIAAAATCWVVEAGLPAPSVNPLRASTGTAASSAMPDLLDLDSGLARRVRRCRPPGARRRTRSTTPARRSSRTLGLVVVRATALDVGPAPATDVARIGRTSAGRPARGRWTWRPSPLPTASPRVVSDGPTGRCGGPRTSPLAEWCVSDAVRCRGRGRGACPRGRPAGPRRRAGWGGSRCAAARRPAGTAAAATPPGSSCG